MNWMIKISAPYWMAGVHLFKTKREAESFALHWRAANDKRLHPALTPDPLVGPHKLNSSGLP